MGCYERWQIEGRENCHAVADGEQRVCYPWDFSARGTSSGTEDFGELAVFVEAEGQVCCACCDELIWPGGGS